MVRGGGGGGYYQAALGTGPVTTEHPLPCRTLVACPPPTHPLIGWRWSPRSRGPAPTHAPTHAAFDRRDQVLGDALGAAPNAHKAHPKPPCSRTAAPLCGPPCSSAARSASARAGRAAARRARPPGGARGGPSRAAGGWSPVGAGGERGDACSAARTCRAAQDRGRRGGGGCTGTISPGKFSRGGFRRPWESPSSNTCSALPTPLNFAGDNFATFLEHENFPRTSSPTKSPAPVKGGFCQRKFRGGGGFATLAHPQAPTAPRTP